MNWQPGRTLADIEKEAILDAIRFYEGNKTHAANSLGISLRTIHNKLEQYGATKKEGNPAGVDQHESRGGPGGDRKRTKAAAPRGNLPTVDGAT